MMKIVKSLRSGQITIPIEMREKLAISPATFLQLSLVNEEIRLRPISLNETLAGSGWLKELYQLFNKPRKTAGKYAGKTIDKDIAEAVKAVRKP